MVKPSGWTGGKPACLTCSSKPWGDLAGTQHTRRPMGEGQSPGGGGAQRLSFTHRWHCHPEPRVSV